MKAKRRKARRISPNNKKPSMNPALSEEEKKPAKPLLIIDEMDTDLPKKHTSKKKKTTHTLSKEEENLLTLIANTIVEIILREEL